MRADRKYVGICEYKTLQLTVLTLKIYVKVKVPIEIYCCFYSIKGHVMFQIFRFEIEWQFIQKLNSESSKTVALFELWLGKWIMVRFYLYSKAFNVILQADPFSEISGIQCWTKM